MKAKLLAYKWTWLFGVAFLGSLLWSVTFCDGFSDLFVLLFLVVFFASIVASVVIGVNQRSKVALYRVLLNVIFCLLLFPTIRLGGFLRDRLFLTRLSRFQEVTSLLVKDEVAKANGDAFYAVVSLPPGFSNLNVSDRVLINATKKNITVRYSMRDSNALSTRGYMYRSDDDPTALGKEFPKTGYTQVAPHWFFFSE
jgi:hypothetical protein